MLIVLLLITLLPFKENPFLNDYKGDWTFTKYVGGACAIYAVVYLACNGRFPRYLGSWQARLYLPFTLLVYISYMFTRTSSSMNPILMVTSLSVLGFILLSVIDSMKRLRWVLMTAVGSVALASLYVIREWQKNKGWATGSRGAWVVGDTNHFGITAICGITLAWYLAQERRSKWERLFCWGCLLLTFAAAIIGASRGGFLGLVAAMLFAAIRSRKRTRNIFVVLVLLVGFNVAYPYSPLQRLLHPSRSDSESSDNHRASWQVALEMVREHPITGIGIGELKSQFNKYRPAWYEGPASMAHNAYLSVAAETGIPGFLLFLSVIIATYISLERTSRKRSIPPLITEAAVALQAGLVGASVSIFFIPAEYHEHLWFIIVMSMCLPPLAIQLPKRRVAQRQRAETVELSQG